jgi:hypothetical protein
LRPTLAGAALCALIVVGLQVAKGRSLGSALILGGFSDKPGMSGARLDYWRQTLRLIRAEPFGVGLDRFEFEFIPFQRLGNTLSPYSVLLSPHNEFLRYPAEEGILLALAYLLLLTLFLRAWWRRAPPGSRALLAPIGLFYAVEMSVQFPWQLAFPCFFGAIAFGAMAAELWPGSWIPERRLRRVLATVLLVLLFAGTAAAWTVRAFERSDEAERVGFACRLAPAHWRACLRATRILVAKGDLREARARVEAELDRAPWNFYAWRMLASIAARENKHLESCYFTWRYVDLFRSMDPGAVEVLNSCPKAWISYFDRKRPMHFPRNRLQPGLPRARPEQKPSGSPSG